MHWPRTRPSPRRAPREVAAHPLPAGRPGRRGPGWTGRREGASWRAERDYNYDGGLTCCEIRSTRSPSAGGLRQHRRDDYPHKRATIAQRSEAVKRRVPCKQSRTVGQILGEAPSEFGQVSVMSDVQPSTTSQKVLTSPCSSFRWPSFRHDLAPAFLRSFACPRVGS